MYSFRDQLQPVSTGFLRFFAVPVHGSCILKLSGTGPVRGPSKKGNRTETGPDFKALIMRKHNNVKSESNWSIFRRDFTPGFETLFERGVNQGLYDVDDPLEMFVNFHYL